MSDLRNIIDENEAFGELRMWYDTYRRAKQVAVIVESKPNEKLFGKFFQQCFFIPCNGWFKVLRTIETANEQQLEGVIAIIDADFRRIENTIPDIENLFLTDHHDTEIMLVNSPAWDSVLYQHADLSVKADGSPSKLEAFEAKKGQAIKATLLGLAQQIAYLRLLKERENLDLKFRVLKGDKFSYIKYANFIDKETLELDVEKMKQTVEQKSNKQGLFQDDNLNDELKAIQEETHDLLELCNGHDVLHILSLALERAISNKRSGTKIAGEQLEKDLIIAYRYDDFRQTELFINLQEWQTNTPPFLLLKTQAN